MQLLLPFIAGQIARRWIGDWVARNKGWLKSVDQGSILLVVFGAFSHAVVEGIWQTVPLTELLGLVVACCLLLALVLGLTAWLGRRLGFNVETVSPSSSPAPRRAWPPACRWRRCCLPAARWVR